MLEYDCPAMLYSEHVRTKMPIKLITQGLTVNCFRDKFVYVTKLNRKRATIRKRKHKQKESTNQDRKKHGGLNPLNDL